MDEIQEEIVLVASIIDKLLASHGSLRADQLAPLTKRLRKAADNIGAANEDLKGSAAAYSPLTRTLRSADGTAAVIQATGQKPSKRSALYSRPAQAPTSRSQRPKQKSAEVAQQQRGVSELHISSEVSQALCCSLYNVLESTVMLLHGSLGHVFVKSGEDMAAIANVAKKLVFPPHQVRHRCMGNADAEVLGSSIALNRFVDDGEKKTAVLIFPIHSQDGSVLGERTPIATIHVERKEHVSEAFSYNDECIMYFASLFCGELMSRLPQLDWLDSFYDPATQHIVAPFVPHVPVRLPPIKQGAGRTASRQSTQTSNTSKESSRIAAQLSQKIDAKATEVLIRRESLPSGNAKAFAPGVAHMPSLLEIQAYVDNLQSCWKKNMTENVGLLETERGTQQNLKAARSELLSTRRQLAAANEKLRLYELQSKDYKFEYGALKTELETYMDGLERLH